MTQYHAAVALNAMVLGQKAAPGTEEFDLFVKEVTKEITIKAGQKCTAVRRILVPEYFIEAEREYKTLSIEFIKDQIIRNRKDVDNALLSQTLNEKISISLGS